MEQNSERCFFRHSKQKEKAFHALSGLQHHHCYRTALKLDLMNKETDKLQTNTMAAGKLDSCFGRELKILVVLCILVFCAPLTTCQI